MSVGKKKFREFSHRLPELFKKLENTEAVVIKEFKSKGRQPGIYVFIENGKPVHVGRTRNIQGRLRGHTTKNHSSASFAFKRTRKKLEKKATYKQKGSRADLMNNSKFYKEFEKQIELIKRMKIKFLCVESHIDQYLLELYAHLEWSLDTNEFDTH